MSGSSWTESTAIYPSGPAEDMDVKHIPQAKPYFPPVGMDAKNLCSHSVQFYEDDSVFLDSLSQYIGSALGAGRSCVLLVTKLHREGIDERLQSWGIDLSYAMSQARYQVLDAHEALHRFMIGGWPDRDLFFRTVEPYFERAQTTSGDRPANAIVAFGELVTVLMEHGYPEAAVYLEQLWNELAHRYCFTLRCAYPMAYFGTDARSALFRRVCAEHTDVIPGESYTRLISDADRGRMVSTLQQQATAARSAMALREEAIEQRLRAEEKLRQVEAFAHTIVESSVDCVTVLDLDGRLEYMNRPGLEAMEIEESSQVLGQRWTESWKEEDRERAEAAMAAAAAGALGSFQGECATASGAYKAWDVKITPARNSSGEVEKLIAVSRDITELRLAQLAAINAEKLATAGRMAATIAHEINNPLEAVTNFIFLALNAEDLAPEVRRYLESADRELTRVAHIARQTLGFYRSTSLDRWVTVYDLIRDALMVYERRLRNKEIRVEVSIDPDLRIYGKDGELRQALLNLTANSIDACRTGGRIWFRAQKSYHRRKGHEEGVRITLADNGTGMAPEVQQRVFAPFFTTKSEVGTGIGLWVTKCLIEQRGGYVSFRSRQGDQSGTVMSFFVPGSNTRRESPVQTMAASV